MSDAADAPPSQAATAEHPSRGDGSRRRAGSIPPKRRLKRYLADRAADGEFYFKCKFIADDVDLTASQIGTYLAALRDADTAFEVEPWSYSNATTWRVRPID